MAHLKKAVIEVPRASVPKHNMIYSLNPLPPYSAQYSNKPSNLSAPVVAQKVAHSTTYQENLGTSSESWAFFSRSSSLHSHTFQIGKVSLKRSLEQLHLSVMGKVKPINKNGCLTVQPGGKTKKLRMGLKTP